MADKTRKDALDAMLGRLLCKAGFHKFGPEYTTSGRDAFFGMGHSRRDCQRHGCKWFRAWLN